MKYHTISLCTVCMNRTAHLKETLLRNIEDNIDYPHLEYVLLNYGSKDEMHEWVLDTFDRYLQSGLLKYYRTQTPEVFKMSHAKNMVFRRATGDILCSIDADNYTGEGFAAYVNGVFKREGNLFMAPPWTDGRKKWWDVQGRLCLWKDDYYQFRGYDEAFMDYGYEDQDLKQRMQQAGRRKAVIRNVKYLQAIAHSDSMRMAGGLSRRTVGNILMAPAGKYDWDLYYLRSDQQYEQFRVYAPQILLPLPEMLPVIHDDLEGIRFTHGTMGSYIHTAQGLVLRQNGCTQAEDLLSCDAHKLCDVKGRLYYKLRTGPLMDQLLLLRSCWLGKQRLIENREHPGPVNPGGFGDGQVTAEMGNPKPHLSYFIH